MIVDRRLRCAAMLRVFREVSADNRAVVRDEDLEREWHRMTGLRTADLVSALHEMVDRGHLSVHRAAGTRRDYELTAAGRGDLLWREGLLDVRDWFILAGARARAVLTLFRRSRPEPPAQERRQGGRGEKSP